MSERKNIDRLFQEKFKDLEVNPPETVWTNIEAKLDEKKKRRIIPFWWKLSGVAAVFILGFLLTKSIYNSEIKSGPSINAPANKNTIVDETNSNKTKKQNNKAGFNKNELKNNSSSAKAVVSNSNTVDSSAPEENKTNKAIVSSKSDVAEKAWASHRSLKIKSNAFGNKNAAAESVFEKAQKQVAQKTTNNPSIVENEIAQTDLKAKNKQTNSSASETRANGEQSGAKAPINLDDLKGSSISKIATKEIEKKVNDTASKNSVANNELEELLNEKESKVKQESKRNRWQLTSNVAPIFLGSISNGSPIDSTLTKNSKSYNTNVGFGLGVSYVVNKKVTVRTGINKVDISYNTNDIGFFTGIQAKMLTNVTPTVSSSMINVHSLNGGVSNTPSENGLLPFENTLLLENTGYLKQEIGYLEMPIEMTYSLFDKKFGLKIIGGFSTLFLQDNSITIVSEERNVLLGRANNLNDIHFSTNFGLGIKYGFMKSFEFNLEPTVKYQLNTFSSNAGNFKPYIFGVYSGISYKF